VRKRVTLGVYIGNCLVNAEEYECPVSVINTTDKAVEITTPHVTVEEIESDTSATIRYIRYKRLKTESQPPREPSGSDDYYVPTI